MVLPPRTSPPHNKYHHCSFLSWQELLLSQVTNGYLEVLSCLHHKRAKTSLPTLQEDSCLTENPRRRGSKSLGPERKRAKKSTALHSCRCAGNSTAWPWDICLLLVVEHSPGVSILLIIWWKRRVKVSSQNQGGNDGFCLLFHKVRINMRYLSILQVSSFCSSPSPIVKDRNQMQEMGMIQSL